MLMTVLPVCGSLWPCASTVTALALEDETALLMAEFHGSNTSMPRGGASNAFMMSFSNPFWLNRKIDILGVDEPNAGGGVGGIGIVGALIKRLSLVKLAL